MHSIACKLDPSGNFPVGYVVQHIIPMNTNYFLPCDGRKLQISQYPELYKVLGMTFGGGNGMFNLPNFTHVIEPKLVYQDYWETWPCINCGRIFADHHDRSTWWCLKPLNGETLHKTYMPMTNLEYLELKTTEKETLCHTDAGSTED